MLMHSLLALFLTASALVEPAHHGQVPAPSSSHEPGHEPPSSPEVAPASTVKLPQAQGYEPPFDEARLASWIEANGPLLLQLSAMEDSKIGAALHDHRQRLKALQQTGRELMAQWSTPREPPSTQLCAKQERSLGALADARAALDGELLNTLEAWFTYDRTRRWMRFRTEADAMIRPAPERAPFWMAAPRLDLLLLEELSLHPESARDMEAAQAYVDTYQFEALRHWKDIRAWHVHLARTDCQFAQAAERAAKAAEQGGDSSLGAIAAQREELRRRYVDAVWHLHRLQDKSLDHLYVLLTPENAARVTHAFWKAAGVAAGLDWWPDQVERFRQEVLTALDTPFRAGSSADAGTTQDHESRQARRTRVTALLDAEYQAALQRIQAKCRADGDAERSIRPGATPPTAGPRTVDDATTRANADALAQMVDEIWMLLTPQEQAAIEKPRFQATPVQ